MILFAGNNSIFVKYFRRDLKQILIISIPLLLFLSHTIFYLTPFEDAYITFRYADNFAQGLGFVFNQGERVEGFTSFFWTLILGLYGKTGFDIPTFAVILSIYFGAGILFIVYFFAKKLNFTQMETLALLVLTAMNPCLAYWSATGMETSAALFILFLAVFVLIFKSSYLLSGILSGLLFLTRPDLAPFVAIPVIYIILWQNKKLSLIIRFILPVGLIMASITIFRLIYFGYPLPNTFYTKVDPSVFQSFTGIKYLTGAFFTCAMFLPALAVIPVFFLYRNEWPFYLAVSLIFLINIFSVIFIGADTFPYLRFVLPMLIAGNILFIAMLKKVPFFLPKKIINQAFILFISLIFGAYQFTGVFFKRSSYEITKTMTHYQYYQRQIELNSGYFEIGEFLKRQMPASSVMALNACGIIPYVSKLKIIDMLGLSDEHIAHRNIPLGHKFIGHEKYDSAYVLNQKPDIIMLGIPNLTDFLLQNDEIEPFYFRFFPMHTGDKEIFYSQDFRTNYRAYSFRLNNGKYFNVFLNNNFKLNPIRLQNLGIINLLYAKQLSTECSSAKKLKNRQNKRPYCLFKFTLSVKRAFFPADAASIPALSGRIHGIKLIMSYSVKENFPRLN